MRIFLAAILLISLASCKSRKAAAFKESIMQKERTAFHILLDKNGPETQKLNCLIKDDYKGALAFVDEEEKRFDTLIKEIETLPAGGIQQGPELKRAAVDYYAALKALHIFDRAEIAQQEASLHVKDDALRGAQDKYLQLTIQKQTMYKVLYEKERAFHQALEKFSAINGI